MALHFVESHKCYYIRKLFRMWDTSRCAYIITRSPEQNNSIEIEDVPVEEDLVNLKPYRNACVVFVIC